MPEAEQRPAGQMTEREANLIADVFARDIEMRGLDQRPAVPDAPGVGLRDLLESVLDYTRHGDECDALDPIECEPCVCGLDGAEDRLNAALAASEAERERLVKAVEAWKRIADHVAARRWPIPLWGALLWEQANEATRAALAAERPAGVGD